MTASVETQEGRGGEGCGGTEMFYYVTMKTGLDWSGQNSSNVIFSRQERRERQDQDQGQYVGLTDTLELIRQQGRTETGHADTNLS